MTGKRVIVGGHVDLVHQSGECTTYGTCMFCDGGLFACTVCNSFEGATVDDCPGEPMTYEQREAVYAGNLNYRAGKWREECCQIRRPAYDLDAYMAEEGYMRVADPSRPSGYRWDKAS